MNELEQLQRDHAAAKSRMTRGIVFIIIATVLSCIGSAIVSGTTYSSNANLTTLVIALVFFIVSLVFYAIGIPTLITGIVRRSKANNAINALKNQQTNH